MSLCRRGSGSPSGRARPARCRASLAKASLAAACLSLWFPGPAESRAATPSPLPPALRGVDPRRISSGVYRALVGSRAASPAPSDPAAPRIAGLVPSSGIKGTAPAILDARISPNLRLGPDPAQLPAGEIDQAEPYVFRSSANPDVALAVFQEGRFSGAEGGSADAGYALSLDGGFTWTRSLVPGLSQVTGGPYFRSTDPVSAVDLQGNLYLSTLDARDSGFTLDDLVVSRSADGGATWTQHVAYSSPNAQLFADKDWLAVNDFAGSPHAGRLVATFTGFVVDASGKPTTSTLFAVISDDGGSTWGGAIPITPSGGGFQGTQPFFLPDGTLICAYQSFFSNNGFNIECSRSADGGSTWSPAVVVAPSQVEYDDPVARTGGGLPAVAVARQSGRIFVAWQAAGAGGAAHILVSRSDDSGLTWTTPIVASDNAAGVSVFNPAVAATPDGAGATVAFYDKRLAPDGNYVDLFAAQSFDGGATWSPEIRVTDYTTDLRLTVLSDTGYMLGDYLGVAPALAAGQGEVAIWCDTRYGNSDPFVARVAPSAVEDYSAWTTVRFTRQEQADAGVSGAGADPDSDGYPNFAEYALGSDPRTAESGGVLAVSGETTGAGATQLALTWTERSTADFSSALQSSADGGVTWSARGEPVETSPAGTMLTAHATLAIPAGSGARVRLVVSPVPAAPSYATPDFVVANGSSRLSNLSCRGPVGSGASQLIAGFVTQGPPTTLLIRAAGPALAPFGVSGFLTDPALTVQDIATGAIAASNDNWGDGGDAQAIASLALSLGAFPFSAGSLDAGLATTLPAGPYTAAVSGAPGSTGSTTLVEIYDADAAPSAGRLRDVSTRGAVGTGANVMIAGFVIAGAEPKRVLVRAVGPGLGPFGVTATLADPRVAVFDQTGTQIAADDDWSLARSPAATAATAVRLGAFALANGSLDAAIVLTLSPGAYTVQVSGVANGSGNALVEVYDAD